MAMAPPQPAPSPPATLAPPAAPAAQSKPASKLLYILVQDDPAPDAKAGEAGPCHRYTRGLLQSTLQLMGCKPRHATKVMDLAIGMLHFL